LSTIINEIIEDSKSLAQFKNIYINDNLCSNTQVFANDNMVRSVLLNQISNSIKFTNTNGVINVSQNIEENHVVISVSDNGNWMNHSILQNLFDVNNGITSLGTVNEKGSGFGLALCKEFFGSNFKFTLPLYKEEILNY